LTVGAKYTAAFFANVVSWNSEGYVEVTADAGDPEIINCRSGLLRWRTGNLESHRQEFISVNQVPYEWDPKAKCPRISKFVLDVMNNDQGAESFMWELFGYALLIGNPFRKSVLFLGEGANGKSTALKPTAEAARF
jgi:putative DNA primase/helicase